MGKGVKRIKGTKLTPKQERFCLEYMIDQNACAAARRAGYKYDKEGPRLLKYYPAVKARIEELRAEQFQRLQMSADEVMIALSRIGRFDPRRMYDEMGNLKMPHEWDDDTALCIAGMDVEERKTVKRKDDDDEVRNEVVQIRKVKVNDRIAALTVLARRHNLFEKEAMSAGGAIGERLAEIVLRAQQSGGGIAGLLGQNRPKAKAK